MCTDPPAVLFARPRCVRRQPRKDLLARGLPGTSPCQPLAPSTEYHSWKCLKYQPTSGALYEELERRVVGAQFTFACHF